MAALTDSGELSLDDIIKNRTAAAGTNVSLKDNSILFASGSEADDRGTLNASQKRTNRAPFTDESISKTPAKYEG